MAIQVSDQKMGSLVCADYIVIFADNKTDLQLMMGKTSEWSNNKKSDMVNFRQESKPLTNVESYLSG